MLDAFVQARIAAFGRQWRYGTDHLRTLWRMDRRSLWNLMRFGQATARRGNLPAGAWHAARLAALRAEDCGPCLQLAVDMARADGVPDLAVRLVLAGDDAALAAHDTQAAAAAAFTRAWLTHADALDEPRKAARRALGDEGFARLVLSVMGARLYPQLKRALGQEGHCAPIEVGGQPVGLDVSPR